MAVKVFISYRREDSAGYAGRILDRLGRELERDHLFIDVDDIPLGRNFVKLLGEEVAKCDVLLAVIGHDWLDARDENGTRRLNDPNDFVRIEVATALQRDIPVIPILLEGTRVPKADELPVDLKELPLRNGLGVHHASFHADMTKLIQELKEYGTQAERRAEEERQTTEAQRKAEAERQAAEAQRKAKAERQAAEAERIAEAERRAAEAQRKAEPERQAAETQRRAEEERQAAETQRRAEEERQAAEAQRRAEEERQAAEAQRKAEAERQAAEARFTACPSSAFRSARGKAGEGQQAAEAHRKARLKWLAPGIALSSLVILLGGIYVLNLEGENATPIPYSRFEALLDEDKIKEVSVTQNEIRGMLKEVDLDGLKDFVTPRVQPAELAEKLTEHHVAYSGVVESHPIATPSLGSSSKPLP
jgi:hypothetical protein